MRFFRKWKISRDDFRRRRSSRQCERRACPALGRNCYRHLWMLTRKHTTAEMADLIPSLDHLIPLAGTFEKRTFSPWTEGGLHQTLVAEQIETLVMTGARRMSACLQPCLARSTSNTMSFWCLTAFAAEPTARMTLPSSCSATDFRCSSKFARRKSFRPPQPSADCGCGPDSFSHSMRPRQD